MKKLKKLSVLALLAVGFALVFGGCSNADDETKTEQGGGGDGTDKGDGSDKKEDEEEKKDPASSEKTGIIIGDKVHAFAKMKVINQYNGERSDAVDSDGSLKIVAANYGFTYVILPEAIDVSAYTKVIISAKKSSDWVDGTGKDDAGNEKADTVMAFEAASGKIEAYENDNIWSDAPAPHSLRYTDTACGVTSWTGSKGYFDAKDLTTDFKDFEIAIADFELLDGNSAYNYKPKVSGAIEKKPTKPANTSDIKEFAIFPRSNEGTLYIKSIKFE